MCETIATLGPSGTDSHRQAEQFGANISLHDTFHAAFEYAKEHGAKLLVPAGFKENRAGKAFAWIDLHFENLETLELEKVWFEKTMPMALLHKSYDLLAIHPSTSSLVSELDNYKHIVYTKSKVEAYQLFQAGKATAAIVSTCLTHETLDDVHIKTEFNPTMVWCLYNTKNGKP